MECRQGTSSSVGKGRHLYTVQYTGQICPAFDELYLLIISIQLEMLCAFPVKSPPGSKIFLYLHSLLFAINIDIGAE